LIKNSLEIIKIDYTEGVGL